MRRNLILVGLAVVMSLVAATASANHSYLTAFTLSDPSPSANSDTTSEMDFGTAHAASSITHIEGIEIAHEDGSGLTPEPNDGDVVASISATARWRAFFCATSTINIQGEWQSPMDTPPASLAGEDVVAQIQFSVLGNTIDAWIVHADTSHGNVSGSHYDVVVDDYGNSTCSSGNASTDATTFGTIDGTNRVVAQNPASCGTYDIEGEYTDKSGIDHSGSTTYDITGC